jgi:hypothetical protein
MKESGTLPWVQLLTLMVDGPDPEPTIRGAIRSFDGTDEGRGHFGFASSGGEPGPVFAGVRAGLRDKQWALRAPIRVWRDGDRMRIEEPDGRPNLIVGDELCWQFDRDHDEPVSSPARVVRYAGGGTELLSRRDAQEFSGDDFTRPTGPVRETTFLGRRAWTVELAPPQHKPHPLQLVVDADTGIVLQQRNDGFGSVDEWVEFVLGEHLEPCLFSWDGPSRSHRDEQADRDAEHEADTARRRAWFEANVAALPIRLELDASTWVHEYDESGAFQASIGASPLGMLARRPRSCTPWELGWSDVQHRWTDDTWDWALSLGAEKLAPDTLDAFKRQFGEPRRP